MTARKASTASESQRLSRTLDSGYMSIYALDDIARRWGQHPLTGHTLQVVIGAIVQDISSDLVQCARIMRDDHPARGEVLKAKALLESVSALAIVATDEYDDQIPLQKEAARTAMATLVFEAGRSFDRALNACGAGDLKAGYLENPDFDPNRVPT